jgi:hypothetical protein
MAAFIAYVVFDGIATGRIWTGQWPNKWAERDIQPIIFWWMVISTTLASAFLCLVAIYFAGWIADPVPIIVSTYRMTLAAAGVR